MGFELPDGWRETPEMFLRGNCDTKLAMIREFRVPIAMEVVIHEINRYADSEFRYAEKPAEVAIVAMVRDFGRQDEARCGLLEGKG